MKVVLILSLALVLLASVTFAASSMVILPAHAPEDIRSSDKKEYVADQQQLADRSVDEEQPQINRQEIAKEHGITEAEVEERYQVWLLLVGDAEDTSFQAFLNWMMEEDEDDSKVPVFERKSRASGVPGSAQQSVLLPKSCRSIKNADSGAPSGVYTIHTIYRQAIEVYCEMGLNGGGYTFIHPMYLPWLKNEELLSMFTDTTSFLLRVPQTNGRQPYAVLGQLPEYKSVPLRLGLNDFTGYSGPVNSGIIGNPFLYFGFLPNSYSTTKQVQGLTVNGFRAAYDRCGTVAASHFALFPNFKEIAPGTAYYPDIIFTYILSNLLASRSGRAMPSDFFMFGEIHFGGCGCYVQTNQMPDVLGFAIGFR